MACAGTRKGVIAGEKQTADFPRYNLHASIINQYINPSKEVRL
jgi:hypothetical protein